MDNPATQLIDAVLTATGELKIQFVCVCEIRVSPVPGANEHPMATPAHIAYFLLGTAAAIGGFIVLVWTGVAWLLSYSNENRLRATVFQHQFAFNEPATHRSPHPLLAAGPMG